MKMIILMNGAFMMNLRKRMHHKAYRTIQTNPTKYPKIKIILSLHQDFISTQEYISKENTDIYRSKMDSSLSDTLSGKSCITDEENVEEHTFRDTLHKTVTERHLLLVISGSSHLEFTPVLK